MIQDALGVPEGFFQGVALSDLFDLCRHEPLRCLHQNSCNAHEDPGIQKAEVHIHTAILLQGHMEAPGVSR